MPPQPMGHVFDDVNLSYNGSILEQRPVLSGLIAKVVTSWSVVEMYTGMVFASLVGENADTTMIVYDSLTSAGAKDGAMSSLASHRLTPDDFKIFTAVMTVVNKSAKQRNAFAHGLIASRDELQDGIVVLDGKLMAIAYYAKLVCEVDHTPASKAYSDIVSSLKKKSRIYKEADLRTLVTQIEAAQQMVAALVVFCRPGHQTANTRDAFLAIPEVAKEVSRIEKRNQPAKHSQNDEP